MLAELAQKHWQLLVDNISKGDYSVYNAPVLPSHEVRGVGSMKLRVERSRTGS